MFIWSSLACALNFHAPLRSNVSWNGRAYIGECRHCGAQIRRHGHRNWRKRNAGVKPHGPTPT